jgi:ABC-2 type transport system permease protein
MVGALIVVYLYNFKVLPMDRTFMREEYLANLLAFLNIGLSGFVVTSLSARFVYPSIGAEGGSFYLRRASPLSMTRFLAHKYLFYAVPFTGLSLLLVLVSSHLLQVRGPIWWLSLYASTVNTWVVVALALGFGALYADFKAENRAAAMGGLGAILFLFSSLAFQVAALVSGAWPAARVARAWLKGAVMEVGDVAILAIWACIFLLLGLQVAGFIFRKGVARLEEMG